MLIAYFDEVKYQPPDQPYYWLGGLIVDASLVKEIEAEVNQLAKECFGTSKLDRDTEFHASEIFHRKHNFKKWNDLKERVSVIQKLATIIGRKEGIGRIYVQLVPARMIADDKFDQRTFMFFVEQVEEYLQIKQDIGMLIGDRESDKVASVFAKALSHYREHGTSYEFGINLERLIDTVHFTESHLSRMLQLADTYVWLLQLSQQKENAYNYPTKELIDYVHKKTHVYAPQMRKIWPTPQSRIFVGG